MTPADHYHSKDCSNLFNLNSFNNNNNNSNNNFSSGINHHSSSSSNNNNNNNSNNNNNMGGQTPVFFAPSSFIVAGHKASQELHDAMQIASNKQAISRGPLQLVDFKEVVGGGGEGGEQIMRMGKRPQLRFVAGSREYDPGPASAGSTGEDMSMEYMDHMEGGEYMDHMEGGVGEMTKKGSRRLGYDQVKALEKAFEVENRLEPERKVRLASQLGLQPRQVAVWFQNRRARWKTKQMERDYSLLKGKFEALKADRDKLLQEKDVLQAELARLKGHVGKEGSILSKQATKGEQDSSTVASLSLVEDAAAHLEASKQAASHHHENEHAELEEEEEEEEELEEASPKVLNEQKLLQNDSLSSTEDSDNGAIVDSTSKAFQEEPEYYAQHWRLPPAPPQLMYKPTSIKNEEWQEHGENMGSFNMPLDTNWYTW